ncbi:hypothetical protein QZH41_012857, partial [Actinostola sp. cb2023]
LSEEQRRLAKAMLEEEAESFSVDDNDIGEAIGLNMKIDLTDDKPVQKTYTAVPRPLYPEIKHYIEDLLNRQFIQKSKSSYSSPVVCIRKKDGDLRLCVDYRELNSKTAPDRFPLSRIQETLESLGGNTWFSMLDQGLGRIDDHLVHPPILAYPDYSLPSVLHTDASADGLGAVRYQKQDGLMRVIGYGSRSLTPAEKNYHLHSGKLEFLVLKLSVCEKFRDHLYYSPPFTICTYNNPLTYVLSTAKLNATGHRWVTELSDFNFTIKYRPGRVNIDADTLSRLPLGFEQFFNSCTEETSLVDVRAISSGVSAQQKDSIWIAAVSDHSNLLQLDQTFPSTSRKDKISPMRPHAL